MAEEKNGERGRERGSGQVRGERGQGLVVVLSTGGSTAAWRQCLALDSAAGGAFMGKTIVEAKNILESIIFIAFTYKNPKNIIHHCFHYPCIFIYHHCIFICCFAFIIILISFSHLVLDNHLVRSRAQSNLLVCWKSGEGQGDETHTTDSPRVRY